MCSLLHSWQTSVINHDTLHPAAASESFSTVLQGITTVNQAGIQGKMTLYVPFLD